MTTGTSTDADIARATPREQGSSRPSVLLPVAVLVVLALSIGATANLLSSLTATQQLYFTLISATALASATGYLMLRARLRSHWLHAAAVLLMPLVVFASVYAFAIVMGHEGPVSVGARPQPVVDPSRAGLDTLRRAQLALDAGQAAEAQALFHESSAELANGPAAARAQSFLGLGAAALMLSDHEAARIAYRTALELAPDSATRARAHEQLGNLESLVGSVAAAEEHLGKAASLYEQNHDAVGRANVLLRRGQLQTRARSFDAARMSLQAAAQGYSDAGQLLGRAQALSGLAELDIVRQAFKAAASHIDEAAKIYKDEGSLIGQASAERLRAALAREQGELANAKRAYDEALALYQKAGDEQAVVQIQQQLAALKPEVQHSRDRAAARALWKQGYALFEQGQVQKAEEKYRLAITKDAQYAPAYNSLGRLRLDSASDEKGLLEAQEFVETALRYLPTYMPAVNNLGVIELKRKNYDAAIATFLKAERLKPNHPLPLGNLALAYLAAGNYEDAQRIAAQLAKVDAAGAKAIQQALDRAVRSTKPQYPAKAKAISAMSKS